MVLSDEVYEHMIFDGERHASIVGHPELYERGVAVFSFGKTMHATGWRVGYTVASPRYHARDPSRAPVQHLQHRLARCSARSRISSRPRPSTTRSSARSIERKRDRFLDCLRNSSFSWTPAAGTYFQLLDFSAVSQQSDVEFADTLLREAGVASIPVSPFYATPPKLTVLRFCFAKNDSTLEEAAERLCRV